MPPQEQVLVVERKVVEEVGMFQGLCFGVKPYLGELFRRGVPRFMARDQAERDPTYKQLIPYVIMTHGDRYLSYVRGKRAGETRLVGQGSIGIGGHINPPDDMPLFDEDFRDTYLQAVEREIAEEVAVEASGPDCIVALLNDDSTEVGSVHLGIVHYRVLDSEKVSKREQMITQMSFMTPGELHGIRDSLETWSGFCVDNLEEIGKSAQAAINLDALFETK